MTQDFAKIRPEPLLEKKPASNPPAWSLMFTGVVLGITIGVFACVLLYLSGRVPPLSQPATATAKLINRVSADNEPGATAESDPDTLLVLNLPMEGYCALHTSAIFKAVALFSARLKERREAEAKGQL